MLNNQKLQQLITLLADGEYHSGVALGQRLSVTRSAIWKMINTQFPALGINVERHQHYGYRIPGGIEFLTQDKITAAMHDKQRAACPPIEIHMTIDSTNTYLLQRIKQQPATAHICLAEQQTQGHGRRGRQWHTGFARNIALSCLWHFPQGAQALTGLSLVVGLIVIDALQRLGIQQLQLKWPNDIMWQQRKLAGIGIESSIDNLGVCYAVIGIGLNMQLPNLKQLTITSLPHDSATHWVDLHTVLGKSCSRNQVAGSIIDELLIQLPRFQRCGLVGFKAAWAKHDMLYQQSVDVHTLHDTISGTMCGIDDNGGLILQTSTGKQHFHMGEISVRKKCA